MSQNEAIAHQTASPGADLHAQLHGPATTSLQDGQSRTLKHDDTFAVFNHSADAVSAPGSPEGVYHRDTRYLSQFHLTMERSDLKLLSSTVSDDNSVLTCDLANPDLFDDQGGLVLAQGLLHFRRSRLLWCASLFERIAVTNFDVRPRRIRFELGIGADFADLFEVRGTKRARKGRSHPARLGRDSVTLGYTGLDEVVRETTLRFSPAPIALTDASATFELNLAARETGVTFVEVGCGSDSVVRPLPGGFFVAVRDSKRAQRATRSRAPKIETSNEVFNETLRRSFSDLSMLTTRLKSGPYPYAGIPWFSTVFGRDALITALQMLWLDPAIARGVLSYLAKNQATEENPAADAQPGKILHEARNGEMAALGEVPFGRYYGSVDATPLFLVVAGAYLKRTGDLAFIRSLLPNLEAAIKWLEQYGDRDGDGFVEYGRQSTNGLTNQGWKDSHDSIFHEDGAFARGPIALVEVQAYVYGARCAMADIYEQLGDPARAVEQITIAGTLQRKFDQSFFDEALGTYALALDGDKRACRVRTSNAGHALFTGIAYPDRAGYVVRTLMSRASFSGWGVRTLASTERRYNPASYHNGSVWPHDNSIIAAGFGRYGFSQEVLRIIEGMFAASTYIDLRRLPELFCGFARGRGRGPTFYPVACAPQAWAAAAPFSLLQSCLGLRFDTLGKEIAFERPALPSFLTNVVLRGVSIAQQSADVSLRRDGARVVVDVLSESHGSSVVRLPPAAS